MAESKSQNQQNASTLAADERPIPSQAEGSVNDVGGSGERPVPSQAEGDRDTVEEDLAQKQNATTASSGKG